MMFGLIEFSWTSCIKPLEKLQHLHPLQQLDADIMLILQSGFTLRMQEIWRNFKTNKNFEGFLF